MTNAWPVAGSGVEGGWLWLNMVGSQWSNTVREPEDDDEKVSVGEPGTSGANGTP